VRLFVDRLKRKVGTNREEVAAELRNFHNKELHNLHSSLNVIGMIKSERIRWMRHVPCIEV
jgi:hypothetical protein